jgi:hypothetical protein
VGSDKQYRPLLRVWTPDTSDIGTELFRAIDYHYASLLYDLEGGRWKNIIAVTSDFDDRSAPVELENGTGRDRAERWIGGILAATGGGLIALCTYYLLERWFG